LRFGIVLIAGIIIISLFYFLQFMFPISPFWFFGYAPGFIAGLFIGYLTKDMGKGILGGLISVFLGSMIGGIVVRLWYGDVNFVNTGLTLGLGLGLVSFLPGVSCAALGALFSKNASRIREFIVKHKRPTIVVVSVICLLLIASIASVTLIATFSHERCDRLVRLLEDQYSYVVTEKPMNLREENFYPFGPTKLVDCGGNDEKFISELLDSGNDTKIYYFKTPTAAYLWLRTSSWDRVAYVRYGLWRFSPIRDFDGSEFALWILTIFVLPTIILIFVAVMSGGTERREEPLAGAPLDSDLLKQYPEELLIKYQCKYPHNPTGVLEWHIHKKMKEGKTRDQALKELNESD